MDWGDWPRTREAVEASERAMEQGERWSILAALAESPDSAMVRLADGVYYESKLPRPDPGE